MEGDRVSGFSESVVAQAALAWRESVGWAVRNGAAIAPCEPDAERDDYVMVCVSRAKSADLAIDR